MWFCAQVASSSSSHYQSDPMAVRSQIHLANRVYYSVCDDEYDDYDDDDELEDEHDDGNDMDMETGSD